MVVVSFLILSALMNSFERCGFPWACVDLFVFNAEVGWLAAFLVRSQRRGRHGWLRLGVLLRLFLSPGLTGWLSIFSLVELDGVWPDGFAG